MSSIHYPAILKNPAHTHKKKLARILQRQYPKIVKTLITQKNGHEIIKSINNPENMADLCVAHRS